MDKDRLLWGIDLGGTKVEGVVLKASNLELLHRERVPTEAQYGYHHILGRIDFLVKKIADTVGRRPSVLGIGTPGAIDPATGLIKNSNSTSLNGQPFKTDLEKILGIRTVVANDANCFALAEAKLGVVQDVLPEAKVIFGVIMGTGVGGGIVVNGEIINGAHRIGGEWGHNPIEIDGEECYCGKIGCVEQVIAGPALQRYYQKISGENRTLKEIHQLHKEGNKHAKATIDRLIQYFGKSLGVVINILDPDCIVLGGGVGNIDELYIEGVQEVKNWVFTAGEMRTKILKPKLGDSAGVFGAALLLNESHS